MADESQSPEVGQPPESLFRFEPIGVSGLDGDQATTLFDIPDTATGYAENQLPSSDTRADASEEARHPANQEEEIVDTIPPLDQDGNPLDASSPEKKDGQTADPEKKEEPAATDEVAELRRTIDEMQEVAEFMSSMTREEFDAVRVVAEEFRKDPVAFIKQYVPQIIPELLAEKMVAGEETDPIQYAEWFADQQLEQKYGSEFIFDASDALIKGTQSYEYARDRQLYMNEGHRNFFKKQEEQVRQKQEQEQLVVQEAVTVARRFGIPDEHFSTVMNLADQIPATAANYYAMMFTYLKANHKLDPYIPKAGTANGKPANGMDRRTDPVPPTMTGVPGSVASNSVLEELFGDFPASYIGEKLNRG